MNTTAPSPGAGFTWPVRVYWEDTDGGGVVFYANYLRYLERARTEWCRAAGIDQSQLQAEQGLVFTVTSAALEFHRPARLDDLLTVTVGVEQVKRASLTLQQQVRRGSPEGELLVTGRVRIACVETAGFRPRALPEPLRRLFAS
jgi:acyl-CoA thioester hydrolase